MLVFAALSETAWNRSDRRTANLEPWRVPVVFRNDVARLNSLWVGIKPSESRSAGVRNVECYDHNEHSGSFHWLFCRREFANIISVCEINQINQPTTQAQAVPGTDFQPSLRSGMKHVHLGSGVVGDVAVALHADSPPFIRRHGAELTPNIAPIMVIPEAFAHGLQVLERPGDMLYLHVAFDVHAAKGSLQPMDPMLSIDWSMQLDDLSRSEINRPLLAPHLSGVIT